MKEIVIHQSYVGLLYENGAYIKTLPPGKHEFNDGFFNTVSRFVSQIDVRERSLTLKGQEILTADKVAIRVSLLVYYKVKDPVLALHSVASYEERIYEDVQLAARRYLASKTLDAILNDRNDISDSVRDDVKESASGYGVEIKRADVKDLVFPGNLREIMNQVLETERRAEAKLIQARKDAETAKLQRESELEGQLKRLEAEKEEMVLRAQAENQALRTRLEAEIEEAQALADNPKLLKLKQLEVLKTLASSGGRFVIGLHDTEIENIMSE